MDNFKILFVDDEREILSIVEDYLSHRGFDITVVDNGMKALDLVKKLDFDLVFTDFKMPEFDGIELLAAIKEFRPEIEVVIVTGHATMESAIKAMKFGGYDYIQKPFRLETLTVLIERVIEEKTLLNQNVQLKRRIKDKQRYKYDELVGMSLKMQEIYEIIDKTSQSNLSILIQGETGTGKELVARTIHNNSHRRDNPFITVNCRSITEGDTKAKLTEYIIGLFTASQGGTMFLDELYEINPAFQAKLIQALQEKKIGNEDNTLSQAIDTRIITATNRDPKEALERGTMQKGLFRLLTDVIIKIPPLEERKEDICLLLNHFLFKFDSGGRKKITGISPESLGILLGYNWPGNLIQLWNVVERAYALGVNEVIEVADLPPEIRAFEKARKNH